MEIHGTLAFHGSATSWVCKDYGMTCQEEGTYKNSKYCNAFRAIRDQCRTSRTGHLASSRQMLPPDKSQSQLVLVARCILKPIEVDKAPVMAGALRCEDCEDV